MSKAMNDNIKEIKAEKHEHCCGYEHNGCSCGCGHDHHNHHEHHKHHDHDGCSCGHDHHHEAEDVKKGIIRMAVGVVFLIAAVFAEKSALNEYIAMGLYIISYIIFGYDVVINAVKSILKGRALDEHFLMAFATICAFAIGELTEAVAVMLFYQVGEFCQEAVVSRSRKSIKGLMEMQIETAFILENDNIVKKDPDEIKVGDIVVVKPGEKVPVDGTIVRGEAALDMSALTGESLPVERSEGDSVLSGSINNSGVIYIRADMEYKDSTVSRIMDMVENASENKSRAESFVTRFAKIYTPVVVVLAAALVIIPVILGCDFKEWLYKALIFLVASCPCALVLSIPLTFFAGIGTMSRNGVLVKGGNYLEALSDIEAIVLDKTGTITKGRFEVTEVEGEDTLKFAASLERYSTHPMAAAVTEYYKGELVNIENVENIPGFGIEGIYEGKAVLVGSERLMKKEGIEVESGKNIYTAVDGRCIGWLNVEDTVKEDSISAIRELKGAGIRNVTMLTGDRASVAERVGEAVGVDTVYSELLPNNKVEKLEELYKKGYKAIGAVGDGINDAPLLARADVGIAMGGIGSDAAIEAADAVIMEDSLSKLPQALKLARKTVGICRQNVVIVIALKIIVLAAAALGFGNMWIAVFADVGVALIAVLNAARIAGTRVK